MRQKGELHSWVEMSTSSQEQKGQLNQVMSLTNSKKVASVASNTSRLNIYANIPSCTLHHQKGDNCTLEN